MRVRWMLVSVMLAAGPAAAAAPSLVVNAPLDDTVGRPTVHVDATCDGGGGAPCATVTLVERVGELNQTLMSWTTASHVVFDVAIEDGAYDDLELYATDASGDGAMITRRVYGDTSSALHEVATVDGTIYDADATRILYEAGGESWIVDRAACTRTDAGAASALALTPKGALLATCTGGACTLDELRDGALVARGPVDPSSLRVAGGYAVWTEGYQPGPLHRLDFAAGDDRVITSDATPDSGAVGPEGTVTYSRVQGGAHAAYRWTPTAELALGPGDLSATDGALAVFDDDDPPTCATRLYADGAAITLSSLCTSPAYLATVRNGRVAYVVPDASGARQLWMRDVSGAAQQLTTAGCDLAPPLADDGSVLARTGDAFTLIAPGTAPRAITKSDPVVVRNANGRWLLAIGRTLFAIDDGAPITCPDPVPVVAPRAPIPDAPEAAAAGAAGCSAAGAKGSWLLALALAFSATRRRTRARDRRGGRSRPRSRPTGG